MRKFAANAGKTAEWYRGWWTTPSQTLSKWRRWSCPCYSEYLEVAALVPQS